MRRKGTTRAECLAQLRAHVAQNVWQLGRKLYRQKTGIPQGSKISSLLCSLFYADLERAHLGFVQRRGTVSRAASSAW